MATAFFQLCMFFILTVIGFSHASENDPIIVNLTTENQLLPLYLSPLQDVQSGFSSEYLKKLESILRNDLNFNGMTYVVKPTKEMAKLDASINFQHPEKASAWKQHRVYYAIKTQISNGQLGAKLFLANTDSIKKIEGLPLSGSFIEDRKKMHLLADLIFKALFNQEGIAQTKLLYTIKVKDPRTGKSTSEVVEADYDGGNAQVVTEQQALCVSPCYFPSKEGSPSRDFAFVSYKSGQPKIYFGNLANGQITRFSLLKGNQFMPAIAPARDKLAFICDVTGNPDLFIQALDPEKGPVGKPIQLFTAAYGTQATPTFSPDGAKLAFVSNKDGAPRIYTLVLPKNDNAKNLKATLLTKQNRENTSPCWSPDGKKIAYSALTKGVRQIWVYEFETGREQQLTDGAFHKENPTFAPNSLHIAFNSLQEDGQADVYILNLNDKKAIKITSGKGDKRFPSWEPRKK
ncbi:Protein TolB [Chlamydiales bacterium STE3]|nr:Protein TolB [Chlamydiales bacterium STE3]